MSLYNTTSTTANCSSEYSSPTKSVGPTNDSSLVTSSANSSTFTIRIDTRLFSVERLIEAMNRYEFTCNVFQRKANVTDSNNCTDLVNTKTSNTTLMLCESLVDPSAKGVVQSLLSTSFLPERIPASAIQPVYGEDGQVVKYRIGTAFATILRFKFQVLGALVVGIANGLNRLGVENCPLAIPKDLFYSGEWEPVQGYVDPVSKRAESFPFIHLADPRLNNSFNSLVFSSPIHAYDFFRDAEQAFDTLAQWIVNAVQRSISLGNSSVANVGGPFFVPAKEYLQRIGRIPATQDGSIIEPSSPRGMELTLHPTLSSRPLDPTHELSMSLHPLYSSEVSHGTLVPYDPKEPGFDINQFAPSAYIATDFPQFRSVGNRGLKRKRNVTDVGREEMTKKARKTGGVM
ncbi:hypothetical protein PQX77_015992 [Marasmius sp. AFHP31]|nr:hypothetical protein PQX77_015992 [Marasmius sp. AFHP31]